MKVIALCPVCRAPRRENLKDSIGSLKHFQIALITLAICGIGFLIDGFPLAAKCLLFYLPFWAVADFLHGIQMREATKCPACGFDPVLYKRDWKAARAEVEVRLQKIVDELRAQHEVVLDRTRKAQEELRKQRLQVSSPVSSSPPDAML